MQQIIQDFQEQKRIAIVGASPNKDNFGKYLMSELQKAGIEGIPVNPRYEQVEGKNCVDTVKELPADINSAILTTPASMTDEIVEQCVDSNITRVWMIKGAGRGVFTESAFQKCRANNIDVVHGFCPMMFFGQGMHKFHFWLKKTFSKLPEGYQVTNN